MFHSARLTLTAWYLAIIMAISILFSLVIYVNVNNEYRQLEHLEDIIAERRMHGLPIPRQLNRSWIDPQLITEARSRFISRLILVNVFIFGVSGVAGYFLAGRTLRPIQEMVDEQQRFIADASHELRTPLTSLRSEIEVGLRNKKLTTHESKALLESNLEEVIQLQRLSDSLLELAQAEKRSSRLQFVKISLYDCIDVAIKTLHGSLKKKQITVEKKGTNVSFVADYARLVELFVILLDNALKYSAEKSVIKVEGKYVKDHVEMYVIDEGYGIEDSELPHIFDRFYRSNKSRSKEQISGYGLGLAIAKKIVEDHNGQISAKSTINKGSTFIIKLPRK